MTTTTKVRQLPEYAFKTRAFPQTERVSKPPRKPVGKSTTTGSAFTATQARKAISVWHDSMLIDQVNLGRAVEASALATMLIAHRRFQNIGLAFDTTVLPDEPGTVVMPEQWTEPERLAAANSEKPKSTQSGLIFGSLGLLFIFASLITEGPARPQFVATVVGAAILGLLVLSQKKKTNEIVR